jgi:hypothetical protein
MAPFWPVAPSQTYDSLSDGTFSARRTIVNFFLLVRWYVFRPECHCKFLFMDQMANFPAGVPLQISFHGSDGKFSSRSAIANFFSLI